MRVASCIGYLIDNYIPFLKDTYYDRYSKNILRAAEASDACSDSAAEPGYAAAQQRQAGPATVQKNWRLGLGPPDHLPQSK